ncbi:xanthine dehydrogenase [Paenibacillus sp. PK3_47]|uniref:XdhC family protein n=1 Tax=Paenibacillus sp. PK3_47 TaxID=2072642 RepID=UPI00201E6416|nr:XdhC/CoxI family protein [Paenibacillus sp. PK3_47]UQZ35364.1 xanthine dehydrogenase [Paenibacillus sp. PK3_47]
MSIHEIVQHIYRHDAPAVLATLIEVEGHSYRKPGAAMLFHEGGTIGSLSPGCLESDLELRTEAVWEKGIPERVEYNMLSPDDFSWGEAVGCGGRITVVLEPVRGELRRVVIESYRRMESGENLMLLREPAAPGYRYSMQVYTGKHQPPVRQKNTGPQQLSLCPVPASAPVLTFAESPVPFYTLLQPKPRLVIFGGGQDSLPVADLAGRSGFRIAVADWREGSLRHAFPGAERVICPPDEAVSRLRIGPQDYVLICSHQTGRDRRFLECLLPAAPRYIGILGSRARVGLLLDGIEPPASMHAPVGLAIGAEGPEEIAVSIVAEMIQIRRAAMRMLPKGVESDESSRYLSGGRPEQTDGSFQNVTEAVAGGYPGERRAQ